MSKCAVLMSNGIGHQHKSRAGFHPALKLTIRLYRQSRLRHYVLTLGGAKRADRGSQTVSEQTGADYLTGRTATGSERLWYNSLSHRYICIVAVHCTVQPQWPI